MASKGEKGEIQCLLRQLQAIRVGTLKIADQDSKRLLTQIPPQLNSLLAGLGFFRCSPNRLPGRRRARKNAATQALTREICPREGS